MRCPRCNYELDARQSPCPRCHLHIRANGRLGSVNRMVPVQESTFGDKVASPSPNDRTAQPNYQIGLPEPTPQKNAPSQVFTSTNGPQQSRLPTSDQLNARNNISSTPKDASLSGIQNPLSARSTPTSGVHMGHLGHLGTPQLAPGALLHRDRYCLQNVRHKQKWPLGIVETIWAATDTRIAKSHVMIYQLEVPDDAPQEAQVIPYTATKIFTSIGRGTRLAALKDVFSEKGHSFFVFEALEGLPLSTLLSNNGGKLPEQEAVVFCLHIAELLNICSQQSPPLVHGNIRPEYIVKRFADSQYALTNFSVALAGGLADIVANMDNGPLSPQSTRELMREKIDLRTDLHSLLEIVHYTLMGWKAADISTIEVEASLSPQLRALLAKGLLAPAHQRYQNPAQLYQDLLTLHNIYNRTAPLLHSSTKNLNTQNVPLNSSIKAEEIALSPSIVRNINSESQAKDGIAPTRETQREQPLLMPRPDELPPLKYAPDMRNAILWFAGMLFVLVLFLGRGLL